MWFPCDIFILSAAFGTRPDGGCCRVTKTHAKFNIRAPVPLRNCARAQTQHAPACVEHDDASCGGWKVGVLREGVEYVSVLMHPVEHGRGRQSQLANPVLTESILSGAVGVPSKTRQAARVSWEHTIWKTYGLLYNPPTVSLTRCYGFQCAEVWGGYRRNPPTVLLTRRSVSR